MPKTVTLIIPPNPFLEDERRNCPLGILYVAAALEQARHDVKVVDLRGMAEEEWRVNIPEADLYGITSTTPEWPYAQRVAQALAGRDGDIVFGGAHSQYVKSQWYRGMRVCHGEGETLLPWMLNAKWGDEVTYLSADLTRLPLPARHLLSVDSVVSTRLCHMGQKATTIMASRGCPFNCTYCASPRLWGRKVRRNTPERVILEAASLIADYGIEELRFQDDELNLNGEWLRELQPLSRMVRFRCNARAECGNWDELREAGCYEVGIGLETCSPEAHRMHKHVDLARTEEGIRAAVASGLAVRLFMIVGLPGDTGPVTQRSIEFLERLPGLAGVHVNIFQPYPGSEIGDNLEKWGQKAISWESILPQNGEPNLPDGLADEWHKLKDYTRERGWSLN